MKGKDQVVQQLWETLRGTRAGEELQSIEYWKSDRYESEIVIIVGKNGNVIKMDIFYDDSFEAIEKIIKCVKEEFC